MNSSKNLGDWENIDMETLEREYLKGELLKFDWKMFARLLVEVTFSLILMLLPAGLVYGSGEFPEYNIFNVEEHVFRANARMEFIRWSIFFAAMYAVFLILQVTIHLGPVIYVKIVEIVKGRIDYEARRNMHHIQAARSWIATAIFFLMAAIISSNILYKSSFLDTINFTLTGRKQQSGGESVVIERLYVLILLLATFQAISSYSIQVISYHFHFNAFAMRIHISNFKFEVLYRLYKALWRGIDQNKLEPSKSKVKRYSSRISLIDHRGLDLSTVERSEEIAKVLFKRLCPSNRDYVIPTDFQPYFDQVERGRAYGVFDLAQSELVDFKEFRLAIISIYEERFNINLSLKCHGQIIKKLESIFTLVALTLTILYGVALFELQKAAVVIAFGVVYGGLNFAMQTLIRTIYDAIQFIFVTHSFDVGDRIIIDGESLLVDRIELFTTSFRRWDNTIVYILNSTLATKTIYNVRRSGNSAENIEVIIPTPTPMDKLWAFRDTMVEFVRKFPKEFTGYSDISSIDIIDAKNLKLTLFVEYRGNFQNVAQKTFRRKLIDAEVIRVCQALTIIQ